MTPTAAIRKQAYAGAVTAGAIYTTTLRLSFKMIKSVRKLRLACVRPQGLDIGPDSLKTFQDALSDSKTVIWNGPMGVFEFEKFAKGTYGVANTLAELTPKVRP